MLAHLFVVSWDLADKAEKWQDENAQMSAFECWIVCECVCVCVLG